MKTCGTFSAIRTARAVSKVAGLLAAFPTEPLYNSERISGRLSAAGRALEDAIKDDTGSAESDEDEPSFTNKEALLAAYPAHSGALLTKATVPAKRVAASALRSADNVDPLPVRGSIKRSALAAFNGDTAVYEAPRLATKKPVVDTHQDTRVTRAWRDHDSYRTRTPRTDEVAEPGPFA